MTRHRKPVVETYYAMTCQKRSSNFRDSLFPTQVLEGGSAKAGLDRIFKPPFSMTGAISRDRERCQFLFCLIKNPLLYQAAWPESGREGRERFLRAPLARAQSERRRRLALASGFRLVREPGVVD